MDNFPELSSNVWEHENDDGIEVKSRTKWESEFDIPDDIIDSVRILNSSLVLNAFSKVFEIQKLIPDPYFSGGGLNIFRMCAITGYRGSKAKKSLKDMNETDF